MNYDKVISELNSIINSNFNIETIRELRKIYILMNKVYRKELIQANSNRKLCAITYETYMDYINDTIWNKLKEEFCFSDETIKKIFDLIKYTDQIEDIYVSDEDVFVKHFNNVSHQLVCKSKELDFVDISAYEFINDNAHKDAELVIKSINNAVKSLIINRVEPEDILLINNDKVDYVINNLNIYVSNNISKILADNTGTQITKVLVTYEDKVFFYDLKRRNNIVILVEHDNVYSVSKMLDKKDKQKIKK